MRQLFDKYMTVNGQPAGNLIVHPNNLRGTYLPKVLADGVRRLGDMFRERKHYICVVADETDDPRTSNDFVVSVDVSLIPKDVNDSDVKSFHLQLCFPEVC